MSVFKAREWWGTRTGDGEETDGAQMAVGNVDNASDGVNKVVIGSYKGVLRIYRPSAKDYRPSDLMLEVELGAPILAVDIGLFGSASQKEVMLAVLHPRRLVVYNAVSTKVQSEQGEDSYMSLHLLYKHSLARSAYNMCKGAFGGAVGKEYLCIQSLDGELLFLEQERMSFSKFLPNFLVPGPLCYAPQPLDAIVTVNSQMECEAFAYKTLAASSSGVASQEDKDNTARRARAEWSVNLGESASAITCGRHTPASRPHGLDIIVLGERSIFWLKESGGVRTSKLLDQPPICMHVYPARAGEPGKADNLLVATSTRQILVFNGDLHLIWAACVEQAAVGMTVMKAGASGGGVSGLVAAVSESGYVCLSYMGTDPPSQVVNTAKAALNYDNMDEEHRRLLQVIREATADKQAEPTDRLSLRAHMPSVVDQESMGMGAAQHSWDSLSVTCKLFVSYSGRESLEDVTITVSAPPPFKCDEPTQVRIRSRMRSRVRLRIRLRIRSRMHYRMRSDRTRGRSVSTCIELPLRMCGKVVPPVKNAAFKITIDTNRTPPSLPALFEDVCPQDGSGGVANVLSFMYHSGTDCTIIVSKNSGRYRIQAGSVEATYLIAAALVSRLSQHFSGKSPVAGEEPFQMGHSEGLEEALEGYFAVISRHFETRTALRATHEALEKSAGQFRLVQKRLLVRFKDRSPAPLKELDTLLQMSYEKMLELAAAGEAGQAQLATAAAALESATRLLLLLLRLRFSLDDQMAAVLEAHLSSKVVDCEMAHGWEETTSIALSLLLKTTLNKKGGKGEGLLPNVPPAMLKDISRLKKMIIDVIERLEART